MRHRIHSHNEIHVAPAFLSDLPIHIHPAYIDVERLLSQIESMLLFIAPAFFTCSDLIKSRVYFQRIEAKAQQDQAQHERRSFPASLSSSRPIRFSLLLFQRQ